MRAHLTMMYWRAIMLLKMLKVARRALGVIFCILAFIFCLRTARNKHILPSKIHLGKTKDQTKTKPVKAVAH